MPPALCQQCGTNRALILRPKNNHKLCKPCFIAVFEAEIHETITANNLFVPGERVAIGASGGKDSTVLASVLKTLNQRHGYGLELILLSIDEGIKGYRDDSLETVKRNAVQYDMPLRIVSYGELYGWTMDQVVEQVGKRGNCTYCGVFRRQALDRGAALIGARHVVTGHNADDMAETVLMNILRGDLPRLSRTTSIITATPSTQSAASAGASAVTMVKRSKPLKYAYEKEIVLYAHHQRLDYFSTECVYSPEAFRGSARALVKSLERVRPSSILDLVRSGEDVARLVPGYQGPGDRGCADAADEGERGCGSAKGAALGFAALGGGGHQAERDQLEIDVAARAAAAAAAAAPAVSGNPADITPRSGTKGAKQTMKRCTICGYLSSQDVCKACILLQGLNKNRPKCEVAPSDANG